MRFSSHKGWPVVYSTGLVEFINKNARGMAPFWFVLVREPDVKLELESVEGSDFKYITEDGIKVEVCSPTGCKPLEDVLDHEVDHLEHYKRIGRPKAMYLLLTSKKFRKEDEKHAKEAEK